MHRLGCAQQNRADGNIAAGSGFEQVVGDIGRVDIGLDQQVGIAQKRGVGHERQPRIAVQRHIAMHFSIHI